MDNKHEAYLILYPRNIYINIIKTLESAICHPWVQENFASLTTIASFLSGNSREFFFRFLHFYGYDCIENQNVRRDPIVVPPSYPPEDFNWFWAKINDWNDIKLTEHSLEGIIMIHLSTSHSAPLSEGRGWSIFS